MLVSGTLATMRVLLAGGGSGGSSAPVLAVAQELRRRGPCEFLYVGTATGPERELVERLEIPFRSVQTGKLRRYWSLQNFADLFRIPLGLVQSFGIVASFRPDVAFAAGGFAAVPPLLAASMLRVPTLIHQQDVEPGLANRILAPFASAITVTFPDSLAHFPRAKTRVTGNPVRQEILAGSREDGLRAFGLSGDLPVVLATGGGTGALGLNRLVAGAAPLMASCQIVHITGKGKGGTALTDVDGPHPDPLPEGEGGKQESLPEGEGGPGGPAGPPAPAPGSGSWMPDRVRHDKSVGRYVQVEFLAEGMGDLLAAADLVISRAGLSTLTELAALGKPSILVPMPDSHQNANARVFARAGAAVVVQEREMTAESLAEAVLGLIEDGPRLAELGAKARSVMEPGAEGRIADEIGRVKSKG